MHNFHAENLNNSRFSAKNQHLPPKLNSEKHIVILANTHKTILVAFCKHKHLKLKKKKKKKKIKLVCENKDADQLRGNLEADQRLCFRYTENTSSSS